MLLVASGANAEDRVLWHGWMNLTPCSKLESRPFPQLPVPKTGPQELHGYIKSMMPDTTEESIKGELANCAAQAAGVAGVTGLLTNASAVWPTFMASFGQCVGNKADAFKDQLFSTTRLETETKCNY